MRSNPKLICALEMRQAPKTDKKNDLNDLTHAQTPNYKAFNRPTDTHTLSLSNVTTNKPNIL